MRLLQRHDEDEIAMNIGPTRCLCADDEAREHERGAAVRLLIAEQGRLERTGRARLIDCPPDSSPSRNHPLSGTPRYVRTARKQTFSRPLR